MAGKSKGSDRIKWFVKIKISTWREFCSLNKFACWVIVFDTLIILFIFLIPFLLKFNFIKLIVSNYLNALQTIEYKTAFIALLAGLLGTIISITGALAIQDIFSKKDAQKLKTLKEQQGLKLFHRLISQEFFDNFNTVNENFTNKDKVVLTSKKLDKLKIKLKIDKFNSLFEKLMDLHPELTLTISEVYILFEKIKQTTDTIIITEEEYSKHIQSYNNFQRKYNH